MWFIKILFGPVLLLQGWWVRLKTPTLPVPVIEPSGEVGQGKILKLLLLGDSSAAGVGAEHVDQSLLAQLLKNLAVNYEVHYQMLAETGRKTHEMLQVLEAQETEKFDVVITALGVNDVTAQVKTNIWIKQQQQLIQLIKTKYQPQLIIMSGLPPVHEFPALSWPLNAFLGAAADEFDSAINQLCQQESGVLFQSLRDYPPDAQAAKDGFHPGPSVYRLWAARLVAEINQEAQTW